MGWGRKEVCLGGGGGGGRKDKLKVKSGQMGMEGKGAVQRERGRITSLSKPTSLSGLAMA